MGRLEGKVAIITGAGAGIGQATARRFAEEGASLVMTDIDGDACQTTRAVFSDMEHVSTLQHDVASEDDWRSVMDHTIERFGRLDILVNNAGVQLTRSLEETSLKDWRHVFSVNSEGTFIGTRGAITAMQRTGGGSIVNVCSTYAIVADGLNGAYCVTKAAALYCADRRYRIRVNAVHPGVIMTPMLEREIAAVTVERKLNDSASVKAEWGRICPLGIGSARDIADGILYLASDESVYVTGSDLVIDGGHIIR